MTTAVVTRDLIIAQTRALKLPGMARTFDSLARQARDAHQPEAGDDARPPEMPAPCKGSVGHGQFVGL